MSEIQPKQARKIWQPLNRKSQILATISALAILIFQIYSWYVHPSRSHSSQPRSDQRLSEQQNQ